MMDRALLKLGAYLLAAAAAAAILWGAWSAFTSWVRAPVVAELEASREQTRKTEERLARCAANGAELEAAIAQQNRAIEAWKVEAERLEAEGRAKAEAARKRAEARYQAAAAELATPRLDPDACRSAEMRARRYLERRRTP